MKALIAYGTRYGATAGTSEEIAKILREEGFDTKIVNPKEEKIKDISEYDLIIVGSGMGNCKYASEAEDLPDVIIFDLVGWKFCETSISDTFMRNDLREIKLYCL